MTKPTIARTSPFGVKVEVGKTYFWCACGKSANQPFCDGSHQDTEFRPVKYETSTAGEIFFCGCKQTKYPPLCDGTHKSV